MLGIKVSLEETLEAVNTGRRRERGMLSDLRGALGKPSGNVRGYRVEEREKGELFSKPLNLCYARGCYKWLNLMICRPWLYLLSLS